MFKKIIRKGFAKLAIFGFLVSLVAPVASQQIAYAGEDIDITIGANMLDVDVQVFNANQQFFLNSNTSNNEFVQVQNFHVTTLSDLFSQPFNFTFEEKTGYTLTVSLNNQMVTENEMSLVNNGTKWRLGIQSPNPGTNLEVLAIYEEDNLPAQEATINVSVNGPNSLNGATVDVTPNIANNFFIAEGANQNFVVPAGQGQNYTVTCGQVNGFTLTTVPNPTLFNNVTAGGNYFVSCNYEKAGDQLVDFEVYTQEQGGLPLGKTYRYSYNGEPFAPTPDAFSKQVGDFVNLTKKISFETEVGFATLGELSITNRTITALPANVSVYLNNFQTPYPFNYQFTDNDKVIVVGTYVQEQAQTATINVAVNGINGQNSANVSIFNTQFVNVPVNSGGSQDFIVNAPGNYTVSCQNDVPGHTLTTNPNPVQVNNIAPNAVVNVACNYVVTPQNNQANINVSVSGPNSLVNGGVSISNTIFNNIAIANGASQDFSVLANANYTVTCQDIPNFDVVSNNPTQLNNVVAGQNYFVSCQYVAEPVVPNTATINVAVSGLVGNNSTLVNISNGAAVNVPVNSGSNQNFVVPANGVLDYTVTCGQVNGYNLTINPNPAQFNNVVAGSVHNVTCSYLAVGQNTATIRVSVNGPNSMDTGARVTITPNVTNNFFINEGTSHDFSVAANGVLDYSVNCEDTVVEGNEVYELVSNDPTAVNNIAVGSIVNVNCTYAASTDQATIRVSVNGPNSMDTGARVTITPNVTNNFFINEGTSHDFSVAANGVLDYSVNCEDTVVEGNEVYELVSNDPTAVNNIAVGSTVNVNCTYVEDNNNNDQATIRVHVDGPNSMNTGARVTITPNVTNNFFINEGTSHDFSVAANGVLDYSVNCEDTVVEGNEVYELVSNDPTAVNNIAVGSIVNVNCTYVEDNNNNDQATIRVHVDGPNDNDFDGAYITITPGVTTNNFINEGDYKSFDVDAGNGEDYQVTCKDVTGYDLNGNNTTYINNIAKGSTVNVYCDYGDDNGDSEIIHVSVDGPSSLSAANVYIPGEFDAKIANGASKNITVDADEDYLVYCEQLTGYELLTAYPVQIQNINNTRNVTCEYEEDGISTGFRVEASPLEQYSYSGQEVTVVVRAINGSNSTVNGVELTHDYDQSKLKLINADGGTDDGNLVEWNLGSMAPGEVETRTLRFRVTGQANETAQNNTRALVDQLNVDDVDNFVHIQGNVITTTPSTPTTTYVYPPTLFKSGPGMLSLVFAGLASLGYAAVRSRKTIISRLKAIRQAS